MSAKPVLLEFVSRGDGANADIAVIINAQTLGSSSSISAVTSSIKSEVGTVGGVGPVFGSPEGHSRARARVRRSPITRSANDSQ